MRKNLKMIMLTMMGTVMLVGPAQAFAADEEIIEYETKTETYTMSTMSDNNPAYVDTLIVPDKPKKAVKKQTKKTSKKKQVAKKKKKVRN